VRGRVLKRRNRESGESDESGRGVGERLLGEWVCSVASSSPNAAAPERAALPSPSTPPSASPTRFLGTGEEPDAFSNFKKASLVAEIR
jgi:hypothetical protein